MFRIFYEFALWLLLLIALPKLIYQRWKYGKYRNSLAQRFGKDFPKIDKKDRKLVWIHAVSVGESKAVAALAKRIKQELDNPIILISSTTETGHAETLRSMPFADYHIYMPLDFRHIICPIVEQAKPDVVILCETDFWYNFLSSCKAVGAFIAVVNGKISIRSLERLKRFGFFSKQLFSLVDKFCVQNALYQNRFEQIGVPSNKIVVTGNIKFDEEYPRLSTEELQRWKEQLGISPDDQVLVIGSSHSPEEEILLDVLRDVWQKCPKLKVLLVPRHPERFNEVAGLLAKKAIPFVRFSAINARTGNESVILVDAMGVLRKCYQLADVAIVAGSYTPRVGGHNIIEPCWFSVPVFFGPHMQTQLELVELVAEYHAGMQVSPENLAEALIACLTDPAKRAELGEGGVKLVHDLRGATSKTWKALDLKK
jgi:3-deoxy-D-manno-octulosonic-acid transferase